MVVKASYRQNAENVPFRNFERLRTMKVKESPVCGRKTNGLQYILV
jgi:hypothetical protein